MKLIDFPQAHVVIAENQPEYLPMPAYIWDDQVITCCWKLSLWERIQLLFTGKIWHSVWTFRRALQPQSLDIKQPQMWMDSARWEQREARKTLVLQNKEPK